MSEIRKLHRAEESFQKALKRGRKLLVATVVWFRQEALNLIRPSAFSVINSTKKIGKRLSAHSQTERIEWNFNNHPNCVSALYKAHKKSNTVCINALFIECKKTHKMVSESVQFKFVHYAARFTPLLSDLKLKAASENFETAKVTAAVRSRFRNNARNDLHTAPSITIRQRPKLGEE